MYVEHIGNMVVKYEEPQDANSSFDFDEVKELVVNFTKSGWNKNIRYSVTGKIPVRKGETKCWVISGKWNESIQAFNEETGETIKVFEPKPYPDNKAWMYNFTKFSINLNNCSDRLRKKLPPTDSRFRPDQLAHENGNFDLATTEKTRLEEKQRAAKKTLQETGGDYKCKYFEQSFDQNGDTIYKMIRDYWQDRKNSDWNHLSDLY